jgi:hypothetical protein
MKSIAFLLCSLPLLADVTADGGAPRGPVHVRADGRIAFGAKGSTVVDTKEGLERVTAMIDAYKRASKKFTIEVNFEKDAHATASTQVLDLLRPLASPLDVPTVDWGKEAIVLKTADVKFTFQADMEAVLMNQTTGKMVLTEVQNRRRIILTAYQKAQRENAEEFPKYQEAYTSMSAVYRDVINRIRLKR